MKHFALLVVFSLLSYGVFSQAEIVKSSNEFTFNLFYSINTADTSLQNTNNFVSPFSVYNALAMAYDGSAKKTSTEMRKVLKFDKDQKVTHQQLCGLLKEFANNANLFKIANAAVVQKNYEFLPSYLKDLTDYDAQITTADFYTEEGRKSAVENTNKFISKATNQKINELITTNDVTELTKLILLNAIYFNANWKTQFKSDKTRQKTFYGKNGVEYVTDFLSGTQKIFFSDTANFTTVRLDYEKKSASMFIIMPEENYDIDKVLEEFSLSKFEQCTANMVELKADFSMPKFKIESSFELSQPLQKLGIKLAFTGKANFSKMNGKNNLMIDKVIHKSYLDVTEAGTEATAATAVIVREKTAMIQKNPSIVINRPFIFVIQENSQNTILFIGKYVKPENIQK